MSGADALAAAAVLSTGDIVLFAGPSSGPSLLRRLRPAAWRAAWTHVGMVLRRAEDPEPLLWEARGSLHMGTVLAPLAARIGRFSGRIGVRCLNRPLEPERCDRLEALRRELACRPRERGLVDLIAAAEDGWLGARPEHLGDPMAAELVAAAYQRLGLLDDVDQGGRLPGGFRARHFAERCGLALKHGYALGPEIVLHERADPSGWHDLAAQTA